MADFNPFNSKIKDIFLGELSIVNRNDFCQFEKAEMIESVIELFPQGAIIVRDTSDIMTYIKDNEIETITFEYEDKRPETYFITNYSYINNASSSTEENFVSIKFSNYLFRLAQNTTVTELLQYEYPKVFNIHKFYEEQIVPKIKDKVPSPYTQPKLYRDNLDASNYMVYRPINPLEQKLDIISENIIQYMYYISSLMCDEDSSLPRYLFWTGFNNEINLKYIFNNYELDPAYDPADESKNYGVYESDVPSSKLSDGKTYKKIYQLLTQPASQYYNRNYYYTRTVPKMLDDGRYESENQDTLLFNHQYLDDGSRFKIEIVTPTGVVDLLPEEKGWSGFEPNTFFGYYTKEDNDNNFRNTSLMTLSYGNSDLYETRVLTGVAEPYPFVDNPEMWKNMFDMTPIHPNIGSETQQNVDGEDTNLQIVYRIRDIRKQDVSKIDQMKEIEKQNFILYVLCCVKELDDVQEETFFAQITGWKRDETLYNWAGYNGEPLIYRYSWNRIAINLGPNDVSSGFPYYTNPEMERWVRVSEGSDPEDINTWAINLNERTNNAYQQEGYYAPGWYANNLNESLFNDVTYRPIGNRTGDLTAVKTTTGMPAPYGWSIVRMTKIPFAKIIKNAKNYSSIITSSQILDQFLNGAAGKYLYYFEKENITDGKCNVTDVIDGPGGLP